MTNYKKEAPNIEEGNPSTVEHYLAEIIDLTIQIDSNDPYAAHYECKKIQDYARKAWDLMPEESAPRIDGGTKNEK